MKEAGAQTIVHICGHMNPVYKEVNEIHSDALSFDSVVPMKEARSELKDRTLMGNVSTTPGIRGAGQGRNSDRKLCEKWFRHHRTGMRSGDAFSAC